MNGSAIELLPDLARYVASTVSETPAIPQERRQKLDGLAKLIAETAGAPSLVFICTHNSRRSHLCQLWATVANAYYRVGLGNYSGGTEVTALNPRAVASLGRAGFEIESPGGTNPGYRVRYSEEREPETCFSKVYSDRINPKSDFIAVMTCDEADAACPIVAGATGRFSLPYVDPKASDDSPAEAETYDARCRQIAVEMFHLFRELSERRQH